LPEIVQIALLVNALGSAFREFPDRHFDAQILLLVQVGGNQESGAILKPENNAFMYVWDKNNKIYFLQSHAYNEQRQHHLDIAETKKFHQEKLCRNLRFVQ